MADFKSRASSASSLVHNFLDSGRAATTTRARVDDAVNAIATAVEIVLGKYIPTTLPESFDGTGTMKYGAVVFPGAIVFGRLFSLATRMATLKHCDAGGAHVPIHTDGVSYAYLCNDEAYFRDLAIAMTREAPVKWEPSDEAFHVARGVECFFSGALTSSVFGPTPITYLHYDVTTARTPLLPPNADPRTAFAEHANAFEIQADTSISRELLERGSPPIIKYAANHSEKRTAIVRQHVNAQLFDAKEHFDCAAVETRSGSKRNYQEVMAAAVAPVDLAPLGQAASEMTTPNVATVYSPSKVSRVNVFDKNPITDEVSEKFTRDREEIHTTLVNAARGSESTKVMRINTATGVDSPIFVEHVRIGARGPVGSLSADDLEKLELLEEAFSEVRRVTTLTYLLSVDGVDLASSKNRLVESDSYIRLVQSGKDNNAFDFRKESGTYRDNVESLCRLFDVSPVGEKNRPSRTVLRVAKMSNVGTEDAESTARVLAQYAYASRHGVGVAFAGAYVFKDDILVDNREIDRWNLLYSPPFNADIEESIYGPVWTRFRDFLLRVVAQVRSGEGVEISNAPLEGLEARVKEWWDEFLEGGSVSFEDELSATYSSTAARPLLDDSIEPRLVESFVRVFSLGGARVYDGFQGTPQGDADPFVDAVRAWRRKRRDRARGSGAMTQDAAWFVDSCGVTLEGERLRRQKCGAAAGQILVMKRPPSFQSKSGHTFWGSMLVVEKMLYEFGKSDYKPEGSVLYKTIGKSKDSNGLDGIAVAKSQFKSVQDELNAVWILLAKMSSVGLLNTDAHLGNYMITPDGADDGPDGERTPRVAKAIDFDPKLSMVLTNKELERGWKPLFVLNTLLVLFTLSQDPSRLSMYELLRNAFRPRFAGGDVTSRPKSVHALNTMRIAHFQDIVAEVVLEIERVQSDVSLKPSLAQELLALEWKGGHKGTGYFDELKKLPMIFLVDLKVARAIPSLLSNTSPRKEAMLQDAVKNALPDNHPARTDVSVAATIDVFKELERDARVSFFPPPEVAGRLLGMDWSLRLNLSWRSINELTYVVHYGWSERQAVVYAALDRRRDKTPIKYSGEALSYAEQATLTDSMNPIELQMFNDKSAELSKLYGMVASHALSHARRSRPTGYRIIDLLCDYVFDSDRHRDSAQDQLRPRYPPKSAEGMPRRQWPTWMPDEMASALALPRDEVPMVIG
jgi:hypothetical protein